jgi:hypothetical protein
MKVNQLFERLTIAGIAQNMFLLLNTLLERKKVLSVH